MSITSYPSMCQSLVMEAQSDATRCCIILILLSLMVGGVIRANMGASPSQYYHCPRFPKNVCRNDSRPRMCHHQSFLVDDGTTKNLEVDKKWIFSILFASLTLKWPWIDLEITLVLCTSKAQLLPMILAAHKLRSCWYLTKYSDFFHNIGLYIIIYRAHDNIYAIIYTLR